MRVLIPCTLAVACAALTSTAFAAEPTPGEMVEVVCKAAPDQKYSCYVPKAYDAQRSWPILYCFSPNANGDSFVQRYKGVCEERGWIVVGSMNSRNGPWAPIKAAIDALWADTAERFHLSRTMRYASGFSGGSRVSFSLASSAREIAGVIGIGAGLPDSTAPRKELATYLMCGETDPNKRELDPLFDQLKQAGNPVRYETFAGGHVMPPTELMEKAVRWLDDLAPEKRARELRAGLAQVQELVEAEEPVEAWRTLIAVRERIPDAPKDVSQQAETLRKQLERVPQVRPEVKARKLYLAALTWLEKNAERVANFSSARLQGLKKLRAVVSKFPGTLAAEAAGERAEELAADSE